MAAKLTDSFQSMSLSGRASSINYLDKFPDEILLMIIPHVAKRSTFDLISLAKTCPRLEHLCRSPSFWVDVRISGFTSWGQLARDLAPWLSSSTKTLNLRWKSQRCDGKERRRQCPKLFRSCSQLEEFRLVNSDLSLKDLELLPPTLRVLTIEDKRSSIRSEDYCEGLEHLEKLERFELILNQRYHIEGRMNHHEFRSQLEMNLPDEARIIVRREFDDSDNDEYYVDYQLGINRTHWGDEDDCYFNDSDDDWMYEARYYRDNDI